MGESRYPQKLTKHLRSLSVEKEDECQIYREWTFSGTEDSGDAERCCPCGKTGIRYLCYITNTKTGRKTFVGSKCVEFFDDDMKEVLQLSLGLMSQGINGKYKGSGKNKKERFEVRASSNLVKKERRLKALFNYVPIYKKWNGKWEIQAFTQQPDLTIDQTYLMKIKSSRWRQKYGTGITFRVVELDALH